jgi:hypothetical protein
MVNKWFGIHHSVSIVDRPQSNGVEPVNKAILRFLRAIVYDERMVHHWSSPGILHWVAYMINSFSHSEAGVVPYEATFGSSDSKFFAFTGFHTTSADSQFVRDLSESINMVRRVAADHQQELVRQRISPNPAVPTLYKAGDLVLLEISKPISKLQPRFLGPYLVLGQVKNDVQVRHVVRDTVSIVHVDHLKIFRGSLDEARKLALLDQDEYQIDAFLAYRGEPLKRRTMEFLVRFCDGDEIWLPWSQDLFNTVQYETFCRSKPELVPLVYTEKVASQRIKSTNRSPILAVDTGDVVFVDLRSNGPAWYATLELPNLHTTTYYLEFVYKEFNPSRTRVRCYCPVFKEHFWVTNDFVTRYGSLHSMPAGGILITQQFADQHPSVKPSLSSLTVRYIYSVPKNFVLLDRPSNSPNV